MANEKRLIDANALIAEYDRVHVGEPGKARKLIADAPTVDAVPVVRCRDCKHLNVLNRKELYAHCPKTNTVFLPFDLDTREHFCSLGERKDGLDYIDSEPAADVEPVKRGRWLPQIVLGTRVWDCSECKTIGNPDWKRCPVCEAKMDEEVSE